MASTDGISGWWSDLTKSFESQQKGIGQILAIGGAINGAIGGFFQAQSQANQLKSQAMTLDFQSKMAEINSRISEFNAENIEQEGQRKAGMVSLRSGQAKGAARATMAARGIQLGEGSAAELIATHDTMKEIDMLTINANTVRMAEAQRTQSVNYQNQASLLGVSSRNMFTSADSISPFAAGLTSLMGSATSIGNSWFLDKRLSAAERLAENRPSTGG